MLGRISLNLAKSCITLPCRNYIKFEVIFTALAYDFRDRVTRCTKSAAEEQQRNDPVTRIKTPSIISVCITHCHHFKVDNQSSDYATETLNNAVAKLVKNVS